MAFARPSARRAFSFFSHSGTIGGRFFTSARPPRIIAAASSPGGSNDGGSSQPKTTDSKTATAADGQTAPTSTAPDAAKLAVESEAPVSVAPVPPTPELAGASQLSFDGWGVTHHPTPSTQDFRLHQFFSLGRPLLGLNQPGASVFDAVSSTAFLAHAKSAESTLEGSEAEESSAEADAHTARQLSHAIVMNRVGSAIAFDAALARLGLDTTDLAVQMDSVKRKRRSKMKKHKLRKRRKLQRATRLKLK
jgi:hypothetical protein